MLRNIVFILIGIIFFLFVGSILYSVLQPRPFSWSETYNALSKQPYGTYVFFKQLKNFFPDVRLRRLNETDLNYYYVDEIFDTDSTDTEGNYYEVVDSTLNLFELNDPHKFNFIALNSELHISNLDVKALLLHLYQGNHALIATEYTNELLLKLLEIEFEYISNDITKNDSLTKVYYKSNFTFVLKKPIQNYTILTDYPQNAEVIAKDNQERVLGVTLNIGKGSITIFTVPKLFTNYYLLKENHEIVNDLVLDLPLRTTYWAQQVVGERVYEEKRSILAYIHSENALTWAFYTLIPGILIFLALQVRRTERPIPIINSPENVSLNFIESVSALFVLHPDNKELIKKKMHYFLEMVREKHHLETNNPDDDFMIRLASKLKVKPSLLSHIFKIYNEAINKQSVTNDEFLRFNKLMQTFKTNR